MPNMPDTDYLGPALEKNNESSTKELDIPTSRGKGRKGGKAMRGKKKAGRRGRKRGGRY